MYDLKEKGKHNNGSEKLLLSSGILIKDCFYKPSSSRIDGGRRKSMI
jgi:hypothetical protein